MSNHFLRFLLLINNKERKDAEITQRVDILFDVLDAEKLFL